MSLAMTSAGSKLWIGNPPAAQTLVALQAVSYTEVKEVVDIGEFGATYALVTHNPLGDRITVKRKGSKNNGTLAVQMAYAPGDAGQALMEAAAESDNSYSFKVVLQDTTEFLFTGQVMSRPVQVGGVDSITSSTCNVEIDSQIWKV